MAEDVDLSSSSSYLLNQWYTRFLFHIRLPRHKRGLLNTLLFSTHLQQCFLAPCACVVSSRPGVPMAEILAAMVVKPLVSMVMEKASSYLLEQYKVMKGMEEQHKLLKRKLPAVLDVITDAEEQAAKNREGAKAWLEELRNMAYKANDVLDEFKYEALRRKAKAEGHYKEFGMDVIKLFPCHNRFVFRCRMAKKLRKILQEIDVLIVEMNTFRFKFKPQPPMSVKWRQTDPNIPDHSVDIASESRKNEKKEIIDALVDQRDNVGFKVLPIVGMGGMGKTTLAQLVYNDSKIQQHFPVRLWVCVSENFDVNCLAERIVEEANKVNGSQANGNTALDKLQNAVSGKRYLLVLDDVWNREAYKWEELRSYLHHGGTGSSVVTTTRDENIAQFMGTIKAHKIKGLDLSSIENIIKRRAFSSQEQRPNDELLKNMIGDVAKRCSGSPLAATALGSALRTKNTVQEWEALLNRSTICDEENRILTILKLSYNCLQSHMRQCFAFCAMFPKDHEIDVEMLIRLWMANSFIPEQQGVCPEVTGKQIFNELAQRSFFQEVKQVRSGTRMHSEEHGYYARTTCKIHDLMHDVAQDSMGKECATVDTELNQSKGFPYTARHLFLSVIILAKDLNPSPEKEPPAIQTLICATQDYLQNLLPECRSLRALKTRLDSGIEECFDIGEPNSVAGTGSPRQKCGICFVCHTFGGKQQGHKTETVATLSEQPQLLCGARRWVPNRPSFLKPKYLHHLRYLDLSGSSHMKEVPEEITTLYHLQTLDLSDCSSLEQLPMAMKYMTTLRHLYTHGCPRLKSMPPDLGHLTSLKTLTCFVAGTGGLGCSNIGELEKLDLGGQLKLSHLENVTGADAKAAKLGDKRNLEELILSWELNATDCDMEAHTTDCDMEAHEEVLEGLRPHDGIKDMRMRCYMGRAYPTWMIKLQGLVELKLQYCKNLEKLSALWELPALQFLYLRSMQNLHCLFSGGAPSKFQKLEVMILEDMPKFVKWSDRNEVQGEEPIFPKVEYLRIWHCRSLTALPKASVIKQSSGRDDTECCRSAFPALRKMELRCLDMFRKWEAVEEEQTTFPSLEELKIKDCPELIALPEAPKLSTLDLLHSSSQQASLQAACRYITSLSSLKVAIRSFSDSVEQNSIEVVVRGHESPMKVLELTGCHVFFSQSCSLALWKCLGNLECLNIYECNDLVSWPQNLFQGMVSLRTLKIDRCRRLTGLTDQASDKQSASERNKLPCLESLDIIMCDSLVQVPNLWAPLKMLYISGCDQLRSMVFGQQERLVSGEGPADTSSSLIVPVSTSDDNLFCFFPCLESLEILGCGGMTDVANLPPSTKTVKIHGCRSLLSLSGEVPSLEKLDIHGCISLQYLPNGPYSSLRVLEIWLCESMQKLLPGKIQECLDHLDEKELDSRHLQEQVEETDSKPESMSDGASTAVVLKQSSTSSPHYLFPCLESLDIRECRGLTEVTNLPPSIKTLTINQCRSLVSLSGEVMSLEKINIFQCPCLESLPIGPAHQTYSSLRVLKIKRCRGIKQLSPSLQQRLDHHEKKDLDPHLLQEQMKLDSKLNFMSDGASTAEQTSSTTSNRCFFPCLESLEIDRCDGLIEVTNLPQSIKTMRIIGCGSLDSLSAEVPLLEELYILHCRSLKSLPDGPAHQAYSSLKVLKIEDCDSIKLLPPSLQQRLDHLKKKDLDPHLLQVPTGRIAALMSKLECFRSKSED